MSRSYAKFYLNKMVEMRLVTKVNQKRKYKKYENENTLSDWIKDIIRRSPEFGELDDGRDVEGESNGLPF